jgi:hypothetical protein
MAHDQTQDGRLTAGRALTRPGRLRKAPWAAAVLIGLTWILAWGPAAAAGHI